MKSFLAATILTTAISGHGLFGPGAMDEGRNLSEKKCNRELNKLKEDLATSNCLKSEWDSRICDFCYAKPTKDHDKAAKDLEFATDEYTWALNYQANLEKKHRVHMINRD